MEENSKGKVLSSLFWKFAERMGAQGVNLIVSIILARILAPEEYGTIALVTIFITISNVFIENGFGTALIQKKNADELDFSSVFYCNVVISIILYIAIFFVSPLIAKFYNNEQLVIILRVLSITVLVSGLKSVQNAYVSKKMIFKKFFICTSIGTISSAVIGIWMAYKGYGVWALVAQQITNNLISTIMLWVTVKWRPALKFSFTRLKDLFSFGWKMLCSGLIDAIYNELYGLAIGKVYNTEQLAYYNKANQFPNLITTNVNGSISAVMLPALSNEQEKKERVKSMMRRAIKTSSFLLFPMMFGLAAVSEPLIKIILTDKWLPAVKLMQLLCFSYALWPIHTINLQAISAMGRSDIFLKLEVIKKVVGVIALVISIPLGIVWMAGIKVITSIISTFINAYPNKKLLNYSYLEQIKDISGSFIISIIMLVAIYVMNYIKINIYLLLMMQIIIGVLIYIGISYLTKNESFNYIVNMLKDKFDKRNKQQQL